MKKTIVTIAALIAGVAAGFMTGMNVGESEEAPKPVVVESEVREQVVVVTNVVVVEVTNTVAASANNALMAGLQSELARTQSVLSDTEAELDRLQTEKAEQEAQREAERQRRMESWQDRVKRMQEEDPEGYAEMVQRRESFRERIQQSVSDKSKFLLDLDTSRMSEEEKASHDEIVKRIAASWAIIEKLQEGGQGSPNREDREVLHDNYHVLNDLYATERDYVLREVGTSIGYDGAEAADFSKYIQEVIELTTPPGPSGRGGFSSRGRGSRDGGNSREGGTAAGGDQ